MNRSNHQIMRRRAEVNNESRWRILFGGTMAVVSVYSRSSTHGILAFYFNTAIVAMSINLIAGLV